MQAKGKWDKAKGAARQTAGNVKYAVEEATKKLSPEHPRPA
jgi:uncharacterized protein YjbJ (UPF0337 family)